MLEADNVSVIYPGSETGRAEHHHVLDGVSFRVERGGRVALIGANGAGKSTLLLCLAGVVPAHSGEIRLDGVSLGKKTLDTFRRGIGLVFQNPDDQLFMPTVFEDVAFGPRNFDDAEGGLALGRGGRKNAAARAKAEGEIAARVDAQLAALGIAALRDRMSHKLSGGEKRMAALASVLVLNPALLLLDEPSAFLDPRARRRLVGVLGGLSQAFVLATHDLDLALDLCGRAILLKEGRVRADGPARDILANAALLDECGLEPPLSMTRPGGELRAGRGEPAASRPAEDGGPVSAGTFPEGQANAGQGRAG